MIESKMESFLYHKKKVYYRGIMWMGYFMSHQKTILLREEEEEEEARPVTVQRVQQTWLMFFQLLYPQLSSPWQSPNNPSLYKLMLQSLRRFRLKSFQSRPPLTLVGSHLQGSHVLLY